MPASQPVPRPPGAAVYSLLIEGAPVALRLKKSPTARRMTLRVSAKDGGVVVTLPAKISVAAGLAFARSQVEWIKGRLGGLPARVPFAEGAMVPVLGVPHQLRHADGAKGGAWAEAGVIHVAGGPEYFARRVTDWLKRRAREEMLARTLPMAESLGRPIGRVVIGDPVSRWGSCSAHGRLAFSWRLVLAPADVVTYVAAHEVAHLVEMNHSPAFWQVLEGLVPNARHWRTWLKSHGQDLHRYG